MCKIGAWQYVAENLDQQGKLLGAAAIGAVLDDEVSKSEVRAKIVAQVERVDRQVVIPPNRITQQSTYVFQVVELKPGAQPSQKLSVGSTGQSEVNPKLQELFQLVSSGLSRQGLDFLRSVIPVPGVRCCRFPSGATAASYLAACSECLLSCFFFRAAMPISPIREYHARTTGGVGLASFIGLRLPRPLSGRSPPASSVDLFSQQHERRGQQPRFLSLPQSSGDTALCPIRIVLSSRRRNTRLGHRRSLNRLLRGPRGHLFNRL